MYTFTAKWTHIPAYQTGKCVLLPIYTFSVTYIPILQQPMRHLVMKIILSDTYS